MTSQNFHLLFPQLQLQWLSSLSVFTPVAWAIILSPSRTLHLWELTWSAPLFDNPLYRCLPLLFPLQDVGTLWKKILYGYGAWVGNLTHWQPSTPVGPPCGLDSSSGQVPSHASPWLFQPLFTLLKTMSLPPSQIQQRPQGTTSSTFYPSSCHLFCIPVHFFSSLPIMVKEGVPLPVQGPPATCVWAFISGTLSHLLPSILPPLLFFNLFLLPPIINIRSHVTYLLKKSWYVIILFKLLENISYSCSNALPFFYFSPLPHCDLASVPVSPLIICWLEERRVLGRRGNAKIWASSKFSPSKSIGWVYKLYGWWAVPTKSGTFQKEPINLLTPIPFSLGCSLIALPGPQKPLLGRWGWGGGFCCHIATAAIMLFSPLLWWPLLFPSLPSSPSRPVGISDDLS